MIIVSASVLKYKVENSNAEAKKWDRFAKGKYSLIVTERKGKCWVNKWKGKSTRSQRDQWMRIQAAGVQNTTKEPEQQPQIKINTVAGSTFTMQSVQISSRCTYYLNMKIIYQFSMRNMLLNVALPLLCKRRRQRVYCVSPLPGNEAILKVHNLFMFPLSHFCPLDRSKAAFSGALSWKPEGETQSNSALRLYSTKQYHHAAIISHPKRKSNISPSLLCSFSAPVLH